jgi:AmmeMemoRadiSam system protein B
MNFSPLSLNFVGNLSPRNLLNNSKTNAIGNTIAIIAPHAGYLYSGDVAALAYNSIPNKKYTNVFILSTSHTSAFAYGSLIDDEEYKTPYGALKLNQNICANLVKDNIFHYSPSYFYNDHTIEVQLPFIKMAVQHDYIVPIMIGDDNIEHIRAMSTELEPYFTDDNLFIISSDFAHYPNYWDAKIIDDETKELIFKRSSSAFIAGIHNLNKPNVVTRMCGWSAYLTALLIMEKQKYLSINILRYKNSGDLPVANPHKTVGYFAINFSK